MFILKNINGTVRAGSNDSRTIGREVYNMIGNEWTANEIIQWCADAKIGDSLNYYNQFIIDCIDESLRPKHDAMVPNQMDILVAMYEDIFGEKLDWNNFEHRINLFAAARFLNRFGVRSSDYKFLLEGDDCGETI